MTSIKALLSVLNKYVVIFLITFPVYANELTGFAALEYRHFFNEEQFLGQKDGTGPSFLAEPEYYHVSADEKTTYTSKVFLRYDPSDDERTHLDVRQFDVVHSKGDWEARIGVSKVYWGVTESQHLVDIINQVDGVEDIDQEDRLGQPMVQLSTFKDWGTLRLLYLPYFRERTYPGREGRLRAPIVIDTNHSLYSNSAEKFHPDSAIRYEHSLGLWDVGLSHFHGTGREPTLRLKGDKLVAFYEIIDQTSLDVQYTNDSWLWKLEAIGRGGQGEYFGAATGGFEYTAYSVLNTSHDLGFLIEYSKDGRDDSAPFTIFDNDVFAGLRYSLNDVSDTAFLGGVTTDTKDGSRFIVFEASHRINTNWKAELDMRLFTNQDADSPIKAMQQDDVAQARLSYFF